MCDLMQKNPVIGAENPEPNDRVKGGPAPDRQRAAEVRHLPVCSRHSLRLPALLLALLSAVAPFVAPSTANAAPAVQSSSELPILTTARQAHSLRSEEAERAYPIHLRGVVTYFDPDYGTGYAAIFVHDSTGSIFVRPLSTSILPIPAGTVVDVWGVSGPGGFGPIVVRPRLRAIGHSHLPANPPRESLSRLENGSEDAQWVEVEGTIHAVFEYSHSVTLQLAMEGGTVSVTLVREPGATYSGLVDAKVRVQGNAAPTINGNSQMIGVHLMAPNLSAVSVVEPAPGDPFQHPPIPIDNLLHWDQFAASYHRVHLRGKVTLNWPGSSLCIQDATRGICVQTVQDTPLAAGDEVDVAGFAATESSAPVLTDAVFRKAGMSEPVAAQPITAQEALIGKHDSEPVQIDGLLIGYDHASADTTLLLTSGKTLFTAILPRGIAESEQSAWKIGSKLRVTGICSVRLDAQSNVREGVAVTKSFRVLLRTPADVTILQRPSWWTPDHALRILASVLTGTLAVLVWVVVLRRRVEHQAVLLRESEQRFRHMAQHDPLTGLATRRVLNDRLHGALEICRNRQKGLGLLMLDVDHFKTINDTFGHQAGDEVLLATANRLKESVRASDMVVRLGGDEFVVLLSDLPDPKIAETIAADAVAALSLPVRFEGFQMPVSVSVGIVTAFAGELDADEMLKHADAALYRAKAHGRHCFQVFTPDGDCAPIWPHAEGIAEESNPASTKCASAKPGACRMALAISSEVRVPIYVGSASRIEALEAPAFGRQ
jgi:diguanylate cyclase (GGDEF)-like protein